MQVTHWDFYNEQLYKESEGNPLTLGNYSKYPRRKFPALPVRNLDFRKIVLQRKREKTRKYLGTIRRTNNVVYLQTKPEIEIMGTCDSWQKGEETDESTGMIQSTHEVMLLHCKSDIEISTTSDCRKKVRETHEPLGMIQSTHEVIYLHFQ